jgi:hypothetical protein
VSLDVRFRRWVDPYKVRQKMGVSKIQWREIHLKLRRLADAS